ncbi:unnamed protein product [Caenorhabditis angaria]|uniref:Uncharacterized protein n=1 Tax=Caenorhabditis angaria TaxID=860376 RepID=A0A9P1J1E4_9PELO|nr:unnamed protein product [Caenorhabditis angaria]
MNGNGDWDELWDQQPALNDYTGKGIDLLERIVVYAKERASLEMEYASKLKALSKKSMIKMKGESELWNSVSYVKGFQEVLNGIVPVATQHETISENLKNNVVGYAQTKIAEYRSAKKQLEVEYGNMSKHLQAVINEMMRAHKDYGKTFKETEAAMLKYAKAEKNMEISRLELEKTKNNYQLKCGMLEESKQGYAAMTAKANEEQSSHFDRKLPQLLDHYKTLHTNRILDTIEALNKCVDAEASVNTIIASCHNDMRKDIAKIDPDHDANTVVENMKSGHPRPQPYVFEDLGHPQSFMGGGSIDNIDATLKKGTLLSRKDGKSGGGGVVRKQSMHQKFFGGNDKKADNGDYGALPPQQRARKILGKITELERDREKSIQSREGVSKMQQAYRENPKLGNPNHCDPQLAQYGREIDALTSQIQKYRVLLEDVNAQLGTTVSANSVGGSDTPPSVRSVSSASSGVTSRVNTLNNDSSRRRLSFTGSGESEPDQISNGNGKDELYEECSIPLLGEAIAQFSFEGTQDGTIKIDAGEKLMLIEKDEGDGWTRVRKHDNSQDGFVPSSYLKVTWFEK